MIQINTPEEQAEYDAEIQSFIDQVIDAARTNSNIPSMKKYTQYVKQLIPGLLEWKFSLWQIVSAKSGSIFIYPSEEQNFEDAITIRAPSSSKYSGLTIVHMQNCLERKIAINANKVLEYLKKHCD